MIPRQRLILGSAWAAWALAAATLTIGCDRQDSPAGEKAREGDSRQTAKNAQGERTPAAPAPPSGENDLSLSAMAQRIARQTATDIQAYRQKLTGLGLAGEKLELALRFADGGTPKCGLMTQRLRQALTESLGRIEGIQLMEASGPAGAGQVAMDVRITTDFEAPFSDVRCECTLKVGDVRRDMRDRFNSEALVRIASGSDAPVVVQAIKGDLAIEFEVKPGWFTIPRGQYSRLALKSGGKTWQPSSLTVGIQNLYDIRTPAGPAAPEPTLAASPAATPTPVPPPAAGADGEPGLTITSPSQGQDVPRAVVVRGEVRGLAQATVRVFVIDVDGEGVRYPQDLQGIVTKDQWSVGRCYFGRSGDVDRGAHFKIVAVATTPDGKTIESLGITVKRQ